MPPLNITLLQTTITWEDPAANLAHYEGLLRGLEATDLIILPEMFTTGFTMDPGPYDEKMDGPAMRWMHQLAERHQAAVVGSLIIEEAGQFYNRLVWMAPDGTYQTYDKRHLFAMAGEHEHYAAGTERLIVEYKGWRICPMICYDLRFPVWARNDDAYDFLIYTANWPNKRAYDWKTLLKARAIENQCYVAAVNRVGTDANGHEYNGDSCVIDPGWRKTLWHADSGAEVVQTLILSKEHLLEVRQRLPFLQDRDRFRVEP
ncbi:MAG: amidohydrolase [Bacteroidota bacterium]